MKVSAAIAAKGGRFVDAPLVRTPKEAEEGRLGIMTGGDPKVIKEIEPILQCFADSIIHAGGTGAGHTLKLVNNFIALGTAAAVAEGIATAARAGIDMTALRDIVMAGGAKSVMFERLIQVPLADDDSAAKFAIGTIPRPPYWTGYRLKPLAIEFWQERPFRLHDRVEFRRDRLAAPWVKTRLYP